MNNAKKSTSIMEEHMAVLLAEVKVHKAKLAQPTIEIEALKNHSGLGPSSVMINKYRPHIDPKKALLRIGPSLSHHR